MSPISELVKTRRSDLRLTYRQAAARSNGLVSHGAINQIELDRLPNHISRRCIDGLALAFDVPRTEVQAAAAASSVSEPRPFTLPRSADNLTVKQRKAVLAYIAALLEK